MTCLSGRAVREDRPPAAGGVTEKDNQMERTVANDVADVISSCGIDKFFMLTGGDQPLWIALKANNIKMVVAHSEASAVYMADGYARAAGTTAVTYGQAGPGAANVAAALADAYWAQSPVTAVTGATATSGRHVNEYQSIEQFAMFDPVTRWNARAEHPGQVGMLLRQAIQMSVAGTPGPTHLDIPKNYFALDGFGHKLPKGPLPAVGSLGQGDPGTASAMAEALLKAKSPVLLAGEGVRFAKAWDELAVFASQAGIPVVATVGGKSSILAAHPNFMGVVGRYSSVRANGILEKADVVLVLGSRLGGLATKGYNVPARTARILQIDHDATAFANPYFPELCLRADLRFALRGLLEALGGGRASSVWLEECRKAVSDWKRAVEAAVAGASEANGLSPMVVLAELEQYAKDITVVADTGYMAAWTSVLYPVARHDSYFRAAGSLGWALPASLGVQMARPEKVVCVSGDGGAGYHLMDIETAVRYRLPVTILIMNNSCLAFEYHEQKYRWNGQIISEANDFCPVNYADAATALGAKGVRVSRGDEAAKALKEAMNHDGPTVIEVMTDREAYPPVTNFDAVMERKI